MDKVFIIAEAGVNHNGELEKAFQLVDVAKESGADAVKFQTFKPGECTGKFAVKVDYIKVSSPDNESRFDITKKLALPYGDFKKIQEHANKKGIIFLTTPDGYESLEYVDSILSLPIIKVSSTELTNLGFLEAVARKRKPVILSTGMGTLSEIEKALEVITVHNTDVTVLHCVSEYPAEPREINLNAMVTIRSAFKVKVGYSDHSMGTEAAVAAVALGASVIEKHFTIDKTLPGPDHKASLSPSELEELVSSVRKTESMMGDGIKRPSASELRNINGIRRSVVAASEIKSGTRLTSDMLILKRPGYGIHPYDMEKIIGMKVNKDFAEDEPIEWKHLL